MVHVEASQFFSSDSGKIIFFMIPFGLAGLGWYLRRLVAQMDVRNEKRAVALEKLVKDMSDVAQSIKAMTATQTEHSRTMDKHDEMLDRLSQIVTATNSTLTAHLEWAHGEYLLLRQQQAGNIPTVPRVPGDAPRPFR